MRKKTKKYFKKPLTNPSRCAIICKRCEQRLSIRQTSYGGIAQLARATGSYPVGHRFKSGFRYHTYRFPNGERYSLYGPVVKRLRHRPFTAVTRVRFPSGSPKTEKALQSGAFSVFEDMFRESEPRKVVRLCKVCAQLLRATTSLCAHGGSDSRPLNGHQKKPDPNFRIRLLYDYSMKQGHYIQCPPPSPSFCPMTISCHSRQRVTKRAFQPDTRTDSV